ncbi:MAG: hypothetical protein ACNA8P_10335, partial [Phycisphaerales bacterium]
MRSDPNDHRRDNDELLKLFQQLDELLDEWDSSRSEQVARLILTGLESPSARLVLRSLLDRAERWRNEYEIDLVRGRGSHAAGEELAQLLFRREEKKAMALLDRERLRKRGELVPSVQYRTPLEPIDDQEVAAFKRLLDCEGLLRVFDPANVVLNGEVHTGWFAITDGCHWSYDQLLDLYRGQPDRSWDPIRRDPQDAMMIDWVLVSIRQQQKWTWVTCDRCFRRLPWGHPLKTVGSERPGWAW